MMTFLVLLILVVLAVVAWRSFSRFRNEQAAQFDSLRQTVADKRWRYEANPSCHVGFRITGEEEGVFWSVTRNDPAAADDLTMPSIVWSNEPSSAGPLTLYLADAQSVAAMRGFLGRFVMRVAEKNLEKQGISVEALRNFFADADVHLFRAPELNARYTVLVADKTIAQRILSDAVEKALLDWPEGKLAVQLSGRNIRISWNTLDFDSEALMRLVELGLSIMRREHEYSPFSAALPISGNDRKAF